MDLLDIDEDVSEQEQPTSRPMDRCYLEIYSDYKAQMSYSSTLEGGGVYIVIVGDGYIFIPVKSSLFNLCRFVRPNSRTESFSSICNSVLGAGGVIEDVSLDDNPLRTMLTDEEFPEDLSTLQIFTPKTVYVFKFISENANPFFVTKLSDFKEIPEILNSNNSRLFRPSKIYALLELKTLTVGSNF